MGWGGGAKSRLKSQLKTWGCGGREPPHPLIGAKVDSTSCQARKNIDYDRTSILTQANFVMFWTHFNCNPLYNDQVTLSQAGICAIEAKPTLLSKTILPEKRLHLYFVLQKPPYRLPGINILCNMCSTRQNRELLFLIPQVLPT